MSTKRTVVTKMTLDMFMPDIQKTVTVTQGDVNRRFEITLVDSGRPFRLGVKWTVALAAVKPSGARIYNSCIVDNGKIIYDFAGGPEIATESGTFEVLFDIYDEVGEVLASPKIWLSVLVNRNREMQSKDQFTATQDILRRLNETEEQKLAMVEAALAKANEAAENAAKTATEVAESMVQEAVANANEAAQNAMQIATEAGERANANANEAAQNAMQIATEAGERANAKANEAAEKAWIAEHQANAAYEIANSHEHSEYLTYSMMGIGNGVAKLDVWGKVPSSQLPSYVDDVLEYASRSAFPSSGEGGKIYVDTSDNTTWRWSGSTYIKISSGIEGVACKVEDIADLTATATELNYMRGVTSGVQDQLDGKADANHTHGASSGLRGYTTSDFATAAKVVTLYGVTTLTLEAGMIFMVDFAGSGDNMMGNVTLNINGTGAYPIMVDGSTFTGYDSKYTGKWSATITYMFNGTHYVWLNTDFCAASAARIMGGTFTGQVAANGSRQTPSVSCLRNSKIVGADTAPTVNGEINWTYK